MRGRCRSRWLRREGRGRWGLARRVAQRGRRPGVMARALRRWGGRPRRGGGRRPRDGGAAAATVLAGGGALELVADRPFGFLRGDLDALDQRRVLGLAPMRLHVTVAIGIEDAELHRIHADEVRELVHLALD